VKMLGEDREVAVWVVDTGVMVIRHLLTLAVIETIDFPGAMGMGDAGDFRRAASVEPAGRKKNVA